jgi:hypothetical protein
MKALIMTLKVLLVKIKALIITLKVLIVELKVTKVMMMKIDQLQKSLITQFWNP